MKKVTVYLPDHLKIALRRIAADKGKSESRLVREAVGKLVRKADPPRPRLPLFRSDDPTLAERLENELGGFGED